MRVCYYGRIHPQPFLESVFALPPQQKAAVNHYWSKPNEEVRGKKSSLESQELRQQGQLPNVQFKLEFEVLLKIIQFVNIFSKILYKGVGGRILQ